MAGALEKLGLTKEDIPQAQGQGQDSALAKLGLTAEDLPATVKTERPESFLPESMQNIGAGLYSGMAKAVAGPIQFTLDAISPEVGDKFTKFINDALQPTEKIYGNSTGYKVGEVGGQIAPTLAVPGMGATFTTSVLGRVLGAGGLGFVMGSSGYHKDAAEADRESSRLIGGGLGGVAGSSVQGVAELAARGINKVANSAALRKGVKQLQERASAFDPMDTKLGKVVSAQVEKVNQKYLGLLNKETTYADKLGAEVSGSDLAEKVGELKDKLTPSIDPDSKVKGILKNLLDKVTPENPEVPSDIERLGPNAKAQAMKLLGLQAKDKSVSYGNLRTWSEEINDALKSKGQKGLTDEQVGLLRDAKKLVDDNITQIQKSAPELKRLFNATQKFKSQTVDLYRDPQFKPLFEGTPAQRLQGAVKIANSNDPELVGQMVKILDKKSRDQVQSGLIKDALERANTNTGIPDPKKFIQYFNREALDPLLDPQTKVMLNGMKNLMSQSALESDKVGKLARMASQTARLTEHGMAIGGIWHLMRTGDIPGSLAIFSGNFIAHQIHNVFDQALKSEQGRSLLLAAGRARPGSPLMAKVASAIAEKFPTAAVTAQATNALTSE